MLKKFHSVASFYFFTFGFLYFLLALFVYNQKFLPQSQVFFNITDVPFAFLALLYLCTSLHTSMEEYQIDSKALSFLIFLVCIVIFGAVVAVNYLFPDVV